MGQLRFCARQDVDPASYGDCEPEECGGQPPHPADIMMFVKRQMADSAPARVICVVPATKRKQLLQAFAQPEGLDSKRPISESCRKNILSLAPACEKRGCITSDARAYLTSFVDGTLPQIPRPTAYKSLAFRLCRLPHGVPDSPPRAWSAPQRPRIIKVLPDRLSPDTESEDEGPVVLDDFR